MAKKTKNKNFDALRNMWDREFAEEFKKNHGIERLTKERKQMTDYAEEKGRYMLEKYKEYSFDPRNKKAREVAENIDEVITDSVLSDLFRISILDFKNQLSIRRVKYQGQALTTENIMDYVREIEEVPQVFLKNASFKNETLLEFERRRFLDYLTEVIKDKMGNIDFYIRDDGSKISLKQCMKKEWITKFEKEFFEKITSEVILDTLESNSLYKDFRAEYKRQNAVLREIPENFIDLYPRARMMQRHFTLHIGGTNSGKTYESLERLKEVKSGVYLAPLRLLALEVQEKMLENNVMCSLSTGEEEDIVPNSTHLSATVEKLDINKDYDLCVIDEAQMLDDPSRGWAWTRAILGVCAEEVHLCMSENAEKIVEKLIEECGDTYTVVRHERNTKLVFEDNEFHYPDDVRANDALIVFSRKNVLSVASELEARGKKVSILYGALPYPVRKSELAKFTSGETDVLVSTDCIGLGLNVRIQRIVFLQTSKFDGFNMRMLNKAEVKQIAGRAGRYGIFDVGYVNAIQDRKYIHHLLDSEYEDIELAKINFPETLLNLDEKLSDTLITWSKIPDKGIFVKTDIERDLKLCRYLEQFDFDKKQMLAFINIPFDEKNENLLYMWQRLVKKFAKGKLNLKEEIRLVPTTSDLAALELAHKQFDLVFSFMKAIGSTDEEVFEKVKKLKFDISMKIIEILKKTKTNFKRCSRCGKKLAWNYPYGICKECYNSSRRYYYNEFFDDEDNIW